jgi:hypothetical protein
MSNRNSNDQGADWVARSNANALTSLNGRRKAGRPRKNPADETTQLFVASLTALSRVMADAKARVSLELSSIGHSGSFSSEKVSGGSTGASNVEADALRASEMKEWREDVRDNERDIDRLIGQQWNLANKHRTAQLPAFSVAGLCKERQQELEGNEHWGNANCNEIGGTEGMCAPDYLACRKWRRDNGMAALGNRAEAS